MRSLRVLAARTRGLFRRKRLEREMEDEIRFHLDMQTEDNLRAGMSAPDARYAAARSFGGIEPMRERYRDQRSLPVIETAFQDIRYALRSMRAGPAFTIAAVLTLGLGIGANTAIFQVLDTVVLRPLPVADPDGLVLLQAVNNGREAGFSYPLLQEILKNQHAVEGIFASYEFSVQGATDLSASLATGEYFRLLGVNAQRGRVFTGDDDTPTSPAVAVISHRCWQRMFAGRPDAIGRTIRINNVNPVIVGVTPPRFFGERVGSVPDVWLPMSLQPRVETFKWLDQPGWALLSPIARLRPGVSLQQAQEELNALYSRLGAIVISSGKNSHLHLDVKPGRRGLPEVREKFSKPLWLLMGAVNLIVLIACCNLANLLLARGEARSHEIGVRMALGAGRARLVRQLLTESLLLAILGSVLGFAFAAWGSRALAGLASNDPGWQIALGINARMLGFTSVLCLSTVAIFALAPALLATKIDPHAALQANGRTRTQGQSAQVLSKGFLVAQVAVSLVLLAGGSVLVRSFRNLTLQEFGYRRDGVLMVRLPFDIGNFRQTRNPAFCDLILDRIRALPGVQTAALAGSGFLEGMQRIGRVALPNRGPDVEDDVRFLSVSTDYFAAMGIPILQGRPVLEQDRDSSQKVAVISETAARHLFGSANPVGRFFSDGDRFDAQHSVQIVGVAHDMRFSGPRDPFRAVIFEALRQAPMPLGAVVLRTTGDPALLARAALAALREVAPNLKTAGATPLTELSESGLGQERMMAVLSSAFAILALLLASVGLYGVIAYGAERRTREIGVRLALGANPRQVVGLLLGELLVLLSIGLAIGGGATLLLGRYVRALLFELSPYDPIALSLSSALLIFVAMCAGFLATQRAARLNPLEALRQG